MWLLFRSLEQMSERGNETLMRNVTRSSGKQLTTKVTTKTTQRHGF